MKQNRRSKYSDEQAYKQISIIRLRTQATNISTFTNYANVAYDRLT